MNAPFRDLLASPKGDERTGIIYPIEYIVKQFCNLLYKHSFLVHIVHGLFQCTTKHTNRDHGIFYLITEFISELSFSEVFTFLIYNNFIKMNCFQKRRCSLTFLTTVRINLILALVSLIDFFSRNNDSSGLNSHSFFHHVSNQSRPPVVGFTL